MSTPLLLQAFALFLGALFLHWIVWKCLNVRSEILYLVLCFFVAPVFLGRLLGFWLQGSMAEAFAVHAFQFALSSIYVFTYPAIKHDNPTFEILFMLRASGDRGLRREEIIRRMCEGSDLFEEKVNEMKSDIFIKSENGRFQLTRMGQALAFFFKGYRRLLKLEKGAG